MAGQGSAWLLGGESGVGKSRLLNELRTQALVQGVLVVRGQASSTGGGLYQIWQDLLRWLLLLAAPTDLDAAVLKPLSTTLPICWGCRSRCPAAGSQSCANPLMEHGYRATSAGDGAAAAVAVDRGSALGG